MQKPATNKLRSTGIHGTKGWLCYVVLIGLVNYLAATTAFALPPPTHSFEGLQQPETNIEGAPPDTNGAVSRDYVMTPLNTGVLIQRKNGDFAGQFGSKEFWGDLVVSDDEVLDPVVVFDPFTNRWFFTASARQDRLLIAASMKSDPRNPLDWWKRAIPNPTNDILDQPKIGFNGKWVAVQVDAVHEPDNYSVIFVFDKGPLLAGTPPSLGGGNVPSQNYSVIVGNASQGVHMSPARTYDPNQPDLYLLQSNRTKQQQTVSAITYYTISGNSAATATFSEGPPVSVANNSWMSSGHTLPNWGGRWIN